MKMPIRQKEREYRKILQTLEIRKNQEGTEDENKIVEGYATTFNSPYVLYDFGDEIVKEQVDKDAFKGCDMADVIMQYDHEGRVFARTSNNTLELFQDDYGLRIKATLGGTKIGQELYEEIKGGYTNKMSFGFSVLEDDIQDAGIENGKQVYLRTIKKFKKLYDVSAVSLPANDQTEISARSFSDGVIANAKMELSRRKEEDEKRQVLKNKIKILCELGKEIK